MEVTRTDLGEIPALACGSGPPLVWLGGLSPEAGVDAPSLRKTIVGSVAAYVGERQVLYLNLWPGLTRGITMEEIAAAHAAALRARFGDEPVDVVGVSTGGSIAQQLAADHPGAVRRLVLQSTACRLGPHGRALQRRVAVRIRRGARRQALAVMAAELVPPRRGQLLAAAVAWMVGPWIFGALDDMATTIEAEDAFDLAACASPIRAPTLLVAGGEDRFYPTALFAETARLIPDCRTEILSGRGHITALSHPSVAPMVLGFLR
jgi:pimeloyl-ACP methyl ester carboxylesterase